MPMFEDKKSGCISMTELRSHPGECVRAVVLHGASFTIMKAGKPVAKLVPIDDEDRDCLAVARALTAEQLRGGTD